MLIRTYKEQWPIAIHIFIKENISTTVGDNKYQDPSTM